MKQGNNNKNLIKAKTAKKDEFYTQYEDIKKEIAAYTLYNSNLFNNKSVLLPCNDINSNFFKYFSDNFKKLGLKKLTAVEYKPEGRAKLLIKRSAYTEPEVSYLTGNGNFKSDEVTHLRDKADIIITNAPFSLFKEFIPWVMESGKLFSVIGNLNAVTYKEIFPHVVNNKLWFGATIHSGDREFMVPEDYPLEATGCRQDKFGNKYISVKGVRWFTNIEFSDRHEPLKLNTMEWNIINNKKAKFINDGMYQKYDNFDALNIPTTDAIPSDYDGIMGVPISFLDKYDPEQFKILGKIDSGKIDKYNLGNPMINGVPQYKRIAIKKINN